MNYATSPALGTWAVGTNLQARIQSTNGSNPINNGVLRFSASKTSGTFTSNGVLCFGRSAGDGGFVPILSASYSVGQSTVTFPDYNVSFLSSNTYRVQRSANGSTACTSLDTNVVSGIITVTADTSPPSVTNLTIGQSTIGVAGTVQVVSPDNNLQYIEVHFSNQGINGLYNCSIRVNRTEALQSWYADVTTAQNADTAAGRTCATVFTGTGVQTIWAKVEAYDWAGKKAPVPTAVHPISTTVNWTPAITSISPLDGVNGQTAGIQVSGTNLPLTMAVSITNQAACTRTSATSTFAAFSCPLTALGSNTLTVKTNTDANGGVVITSRPFLVAATGTPKVTGISPATARLDVMATYIVSGSDLTAGMGFAVEDCDQMTEVVAGGTSSSRSWTCYPRAPGFKKATVKTAPAGTVVAGGTAYVRVEHPQRMGDSASRGNPSVGGVHLFNGNLFMRSVDLAVPGRGLSFAVERTYNSYDWQFEADYGGVPANRPWRFNFEQRIGFVPNTNSKRLYFARADGSGESYFLLNGNWVPVDLGNFSKVVANGDGSYTIQTRGQVSYTFEAPSGTGRLRNMKDRDGNTISYAYDGSGKVNLITDSTGRTYAVTYDAQGRVYRVTDFTGRFVQYTYTDTSTTNARIAQFQDVRGGITTYAYNASNDLTTITDPRGNLALTARYVNVYGSRGVRSLTTAIGRATGGRTCGGLTDFTYCFSYTELANSAGFRTTVDGPENAAVMTVDFDNAGRALSTKDAQNNTRMSEFLDAGADVTRYASSALANVRKSALGVTNGYQTDIGYNLTHGLLESVKDPELSTTQTQWNLDATNNLFTPSTAISALGNATSLGYTTSGRPNRITAPQQVATSGPSTTLTWTSGVVTRITDPLGGFSTLTRDANGNLTRSSDPRNAAWEVVRTYDTLGRVSSVTDARGGVNRFTYDLAGNLKTNTQELPAPATNIVNSYDYDANGNMTRHTDGRGVITDYTFDIGNRLTTITRTVSGVVTTRTLSYDNAGRLVGVTNENSNTSTRLFDSAGRITSEALPLSRTTTYTYDADNRLKTVTDPESRTVSYEYDRVGRVIAVTTVANSTNLTQRYQYDADGRMTAFQDAKGNLTKYGYDRNGNLTTVTDANNVISSAEYDNANRMVSRTDPRGKTTRFTYDAAGNMITEKDPLGNTWTYGYDQNSNLTSVLNPDGRSITHTYDAANRRTRTTYSNTAQVNFTYDGNGNVLTMIDSVGTTTYQYDEANRLKQFTDPFGNVVSYTFDKAGNRKTITYPGSRVVTYGYDAAERMTSVLDWTPRTATYTYNKADQITRLTHGNGTYADYTYDTAGRLTSLINKQSNGTVISSHIHTLDAFGNITQADEILPLQPTLTPRIKRWTVDDANRVLTDSVSGDSFEHDTAGRLIRQIISGATTNFAYNDLDLLTTLTAPGRTESYRYNGQGHRLERTVNGTATRFLIEPNGVMPNLLADTNGSNSPLRFYVYGANGLLSQIDSAGTYRAYHFAPSGHTTALTNGSMIVTDAYALTPYGESQTVGTTPNFFKYFGRQGVVDDLNGLVLMRARLFSTATNRFLSMDRVTGDATNSGSWNKFSFVEGNPLSHNDATGLTRVSNEGHKYLYDRQTGACDTPSFSYGRACPYSEFDFQIARKRWETAEHFVAPKSGFSKFAQNLLKEASDLVLGAGQKVYDQCAEAWEATYGLDVDRAAMGGGYVSAELGVFITGCIARGAGTTASSALDVVDPATYAKVAVHGAVTAFAKDEDVKDINRVVDAIFAAYSFKDVLLDGRITGKDSHKYKHVLNMSKRTGSQLRDALRKAKQETKSELEKTLFDAFSKLVEDLK